MGRASSWFAIDTFSVQGSAIIGLPPLSLQFSFAHLFFLYLHRLDIGIPPMDARTDDSTRPPCNISINPTQESAEPDHHRRSDYLSQLQSTRSTRLPAPPPQPTQAASVVAIANPLASIQGSFLRSLPDATTVAIPETNANTTTSMSDTHVMHGAWGRQNRRFSINRRTTRTTVHVSSRRHRQGNFTQPPTSAANVSPTSDSTTSQPIQETIGGHFLSASLDDSPLFAKAGVSGLHNSPPPHTNHTDINDIPQLSPVVCDLLQQLTAMLPSAMLLDRRVEKEKRRRRLRDTRGDCYDTQLYEDT